ncbi:hypothetical protein TBLA_0C01710 [Henningerozyma blattae CBS 6284]|uniref:Uncharacterized protein n=1 Tax=Henningerozyma blattae (strain ATCC 34711 / CBS 6284 / DSM 70876 / NBRC 10599 / NRRL Y-10934 / UCD 77-7) TaxID=1071380 RepID=I2H0T3_HENB6|nr:hypothetical protein TBLA_0C01710 [Tetrapisispora blattae CBS 6284]CCH59985.1 hypothetical protein TBLA_0C01710 [Tetrapisispora blattae CBS 6284]
MASKIPTLDLDVIANSGTDLSLVMKDLLTQYDTILLKNFANKDQLDVLLYNLDNIDIPDTEQGFDANFTGTIPLANGDPNQNHDESVLIEQYIFNTDENLNFGRPCDNKSLSHLYARLFKLGLYFSQICFNAMVLQSNEIEFNEKKFSAMITRFYTPHVYRQISDTKHLTNEMIDMEDDDEQDELNILTTGDHFNYLHSEDFIDFNSTGIITIFPRATGIKYKPATSSMSDNIWISIEEPDCVLIHTGVLLAKWSNGLHQTSPLKLATHRNVIHCTIAPPLNTKLSGNDGEHHTISNLLLDQQMIQLPQVAKQFYSRDLDILKLEENIRFYKELFNVSETVLSLYMMSRSTKNNPPEIQNLLPQISNMLKKKIDEEMFLKLLTIWPECYIVEANIRFELSIRLPKVDPLHALTTKSRKLEFIEHADIWLEEAKNMKNIPKDIPATHISKRRSSQNLQASKLLHNSQTINEEDAEVMKFSPKKLTNNKTNYISNSSSKYINTEKNFDSQSNLLQRLREKEKKSTELLLQRENNYKLFLTSKMTQIFEIMFLLDWNQPYTETHLNSLIVDSLRDSNNPIGEVEVNEILLKIHEFLPNKFQMYSTDGGLKVYRWDNLDKDEFQLKLAAYKKSFT